MNKTKVNWRFPGSYEQTGAGMKAMDDMRQYVRDGVFSASDVNGVNASSSGMYFGVDGADSDSMGWMNDGSPEHRYQMNIQCCFLNYSNGFSQRLN